MLNFGDYLTISETLLISAISIAVVFVVLSLIAVIISLIGKTLKEEKVQATEETKVQTLSQIKKNQTKVDLNAVVNDKYKLVAMLVAAVAANENDEDANYKITSIKGI